MKALRVLPSEPSPRSAETEVSRKRLQRRCQIEGPGVLSDEELLALLLGRSSGTTSGVNYARDLLEQGGGISLLNRLSPGGLQQLKGIGPSHSYRLSAAFELGRRAAIENTRCHSPQALTKEAVVAWAHPRLAGLEHEEVWALCVNAQSQLKSTWQVGRGGIHGCGLLARDILTPVVRDGAAGFILVHNHPSGDPTPSQEDIELTRGLQLAATTICVPLLDHVVIGKAGSSSFFEQSLL